jgi:hypothetical protein
MCRPQSKFYSIVNMNSGCVIVYRSTIEDAKKRAATLAIDVPNTEFVVFESVCSFTVNPVAQECHHVNRS